MGALGAGHGPFRYELCPQGDENSLPYKMMSQKLRHDPASQRACCHKMGYPGYLPSDIWISLQYNCTS